MQFKYYYDVYQVTRKLGMLPFHKMWNGAKVLRNALDYHAMVFYARPLHVWVVPVPRLVVIKIPVIKR